MLGRYKRADFPGLGGRKAAGSGNSGYLWFPSPWYDRVKAEPVGLDVAKCQGNQGGWIIEGAITNILFHTRLLGSSSEPRVGEPPK